MRIPLSTSYPSFPCHSLDSVPAEFISLLQEGELKFAFCRVRFALPHLNFPTQGKVVLWESLGVLILYHRKQETKQDLSDLNLQFQLRMCTVNI